MIRLFAGKKSAQIREILISESAWEEMTCLFAPSLGLDFDGMCNVIIGLSESDFYKSMTTYSDHTIWQDVYRPRLVTGQVYLKITVIHDVLIVSFKEK
ncbi:mRNA interferase MqsR [Escherichia coli]|uniref:type II toxin-antitoxin system MqsR family toxin n=1 Tax=Escherichia coli TaxID=562 RepID=UPI00092D8490|nr:mRNA interferase MqsR [Escherichia coli]